MFENKEKENYMGKIAWYRTSCSGPISLFGTDVKTDHPISIEIKESSVTRELSCNWYGDEKEILRIEMSSIQWAEFLTSGNTTGVPCTIVRRDGVPMDEVPNTKIIEQYAQESKETFDKFKEGADKIYNKVKEAFDSGKPMGKKQMEELMSYIETYKHNTLANIDFVKKSFNEDMTGVVAKAKAEVNAYIENKALEIGMENLKANINIGIENKNEM